VVRFEATMLADNVAIHRVAAKLAAGPLARRQLGSVAEMEIELAVPSDGPPAIIAACAGS
jgi:hypothetical protein